MPHTGGVWWDAIVCLLEQRRTLSAVVANAGNRHRCRRQLDLDDELADAKALRTVGEHTSGP